MEDFEIKLEAFAAKVEADQRRYYRKQYKTESEHYQGLEDAACTVRIKPGKKYIKVDVGTSGKYMVVNETGEIFGIKAYGVIHRGHSYGTLDTIEGWNWGAYHAVRAAT